MSNAQVNTKKGSRPWTEKFLQSLQEEPNVSRACKTARIGRTIAYVHRKENPEFAAQWDFALKMGMGALEDEAVKRALSGSDTLLIFLLKAHDPAKYRENIDVTSGGKPISYVLNFGEHGSGDSD
jgi:hypothetical protein